MTYSAFVNSYTLHITLYDLFFFGMVFVGLNFALLLAFAKSINRAANRFLALALVAMILWMIRILAIDIRLETYLPHWDRLPMEFLLALGPLIYFYVLKITRPDYQLRGKDLLHFSPLLLEWFALVTETSESAKTGLATYATPVFQIANPVLQLLIFVSIITYLYKSYQLIQKFYRRLQPVLMDRSRLEFRWLRRLIGATALLWFLWIAYAAVDYFGYRSQLGIHVYYPFYIFFAVIIIWTAAAAFLKPQAARLAESAPSLTAPVPAELRSKGNWLKNAIQANLYYQDPDLNLGSLAEKLELTSHELSRIINTVFRKGFSDFINDYRVDDVIRKMQDPANDHITLLGLGYDAGFNSQSTFHRAFKELTGKTPAEYKKELPYYNLTAGLRTAAVISNHKITPMWSYQKLNRSYMIRNYFKIGWRNLVRNKVSSIINISGLAIGLACVLLIGLYVKDELGYDKSFKDDNRIYRVNIHEKMGNNEFVAAHTPPPVGRALQSNFPEVASFTRIFLPGDEVVHYVKNGRREAITEKKILSVDSNFVQFFGYPLLKGDPAKCLNGPNFVVLTETAAKKYFGDENPVGKNLSFDEYSTPFTVTAVMKDPPVQSSLQFDLLQCNLGMPLVKRFSWSWVWLQTGTFVKLNPNVPNTRADIQKLESRFPAMVRVQAASAFRRIGQPYDEFVKKGGKYDIMLQPIRDMHLYSAQIGNRYFVQGDIKYLCIFSAIALFIMVLACVNFMNLSTAQSAKRAKEVGIRKVLGSERRGLILQFLAEAFLYTLLASVIAVLVVIIVLPGFNQLASKSIHFAVLADVRIWSSMLLLMLLTALFAGSYPAFFLTSFKPVSVLKGKADFKTSKTGLSTRNVLVVFQFAVSAVLIICTMVVYKQLLYNQSRDLGYNKENVLVVNDAGRLGNNEESFRRAILALPEVANASISTNLPASEKFFEDDYVPEADPGDAGAPEKTLDMASYIVDDAFVPTLKLRIVSGRAFSKSYNDSASVILNETAARMAGWKNAVGKHLIYPGGDNRRYEVIGVMKDFNAASLHDEVTPWALFYTTSKSYTVGTSFVAVRLQPGDYSKAVAKIQAAWKTFMPDNPFEYNFLDQQYDELYKTDQTMGKVFSVFTGLSIVVACLGLLGLAMYTAERRTKEIGIRKVLGASVQNVVGMLSKDFLKLVLIASVIAFPVAWYAMNSWLQGFAYKTDISWWVFALSTGIVAAIALITISFQSLKAAMGNPVESLRSE